jgi:hypothetical protein
MVNGSFVSIIVATFSGFFVCIIGYYKSKTANMKMLVPITGYLGNLTPAPNFATDQVTSALQLRDVYNTPRCFLEVI